MALHCSGQTAGCRVPQAYGIVRIDASRGQLGPVGTEGQGPPELDIAASRSNNRLYLHVANLAYSRSVEATFPGTTGGRIFEIAPEDLRSYVNQDQPDVFKPREAALPSVPGATWRFPAGSVSVVELDVRPA